LRPGKVDYETVSIEFYDPVSSKSSAVACECCAGPTARGEDMGFLRKSVVFRFAVLATTIDAPLDIRGAVEAAAVRGASVNPTEALRCA